MIESLRVANLTVFSDVHLRFSEGLNVFVGGNGSGKTHVLKILYSIPAASWEESRRAQGSPPTKVVLQTRISEKINGVFRPDTLGRLARRVKGHSRCNILVRFDNSDLDVELSFSSGSKRDVSIQLLPTEWIQSAPVYLPTRELLTIYPNFVSTYESRYLDFEETWRDTCILLGTPLERGPKEESINKLLAPIEDAMQGKIVLDRNGRFYMNSSAGLLEMPLVAEGFRKLGMVARLIATGTLAGIGYLFWDEPEANLNPRVVKQVARTVYDLSRGGTQVFIATHSLFLLRELEIILSKVPKQNRKCRFFGLHSEAGGSKIMQGDNIEDIGDIASLDEELMQSDRFILATS